MGFAQEIWKTWSLEQDLNSAKRHNSREKGSGASCHQISSSFKKVLSQRTPALLCGGCPPGFPYWERWHDLCTLWAGSPRGTALLVTKPPPPDRWPQAPPPWVPRPCHPAAQSKAEDHGLASSLLGHTPFSLECLGARNTGETFLLFDVHSYIWYFLIWCLCPP